MGKDNFVLVMDMLGPSLEDLWWATTGGSGGFSPETVINLADQMIVSRHAPCCRQLGMLQTVGVWVWVWVRCRMGKDEGRGW
eukprot:1485252-Rhodomonas_salina.2